MAANEGESDKFAMLLKFRAEVNATNGEGLSSFHILLMKLMELSSLENKPLRNVEDIEDGMEEILDCMKQLLTHSSFQMDFNSAHSKVKTAGKLSGERKKLGTMTPLQILCSFQTWNAKSISSSLHHKLAEVVQVLVSKDQVDPNATAAKNALPGTVPGSTPPVLLAATRGYFKLIEIFKRRPQTDFLIENKFKQNILHIVLKAGYYNKIVVHGDGAGDHNVNTVYNLFGTNNSYVSEQMKSIVNSLDSYGNSSLHYAKSYPNQDIVIFLLQKGAKIDLNPQNVINISPKTLEEYFYDHCITSEGGDIDDEEFSIKVNFELFEKAAYDSKDNPFKRELAWQMEPADKKPRPENKRKVDTRRLEFFSDVDNLHYLLKHPVLMAFLELELNSLKFGYFVDFFIYLVFVIILFTFLGDRYGVFNLVPINSKHAYVFDSEQTGPIGYYMLILGIYIVLMIFREIVQIIKQKKRYLVASENYIEWIVLVLAIANIIMSMKFVQVEEKEQLIRHMAALCLLIAFIQLYLLFVRVAPNTPIPVYINMFTTVLKTYTFILLSYLAFILSFAYSFFLIFGLHKEVKRKIIEKIDVKTNLTISQSETTEEKEEGDAYFGNIGLSFVKTLVMFIGEMDYNDLQFAHWLGYVIFIGFVYLLVIVLMNILNGLAVSDIHKIQEEVDTYFHISIVETLAHTSFVPMMAGEIAICPNIRPESQKILGISIPGFKVSQGLFYCFMFYNDFHRFTKCRGATRRPFSSAKIQSSPWKSWSRPSNSKSRRWEQKCP